MLGRIAAAPSFLFHLSLINNVSTWHTVRKKQDIQGEVKPPPSPCPLAVYSPCWTEHGATPACSPCDQHLHRVSGRLPLWVTGAPAVVHTRETLSRDPQLLEVMSASCFPHAHFPVFSTLAPYFVITRRCSSGPGSKRQIFVVNFFFFKDRALVKLVCPHLLWNTGPHVSEFNKRPLPTAIQALGADRPHTLFCSGGAALWWSVKCGGEDRIWRTCGRNTGWWEKATFYYFLTALLRDNWL